MKLDQVIAAAIECFRTPGKRVSEYTKVLIANEIVINTGDLR